MAAWAPHIREVDYPQAVVTPGTTGRVTGVGGVVALFRIDAVDHIARTWSWSVRPAPWALVRARRRHGRAELRGRQHGLARDARPVAGGPGLRTRGAPLARPAGHSGVTGPGRPRRGCRRVVHGGAGHPRHLRRDVESRAGRPYFATTARRTDPTPETSRTTRAVPTYVGAPTATAPRTSHARSSTRSVWPRRLVFPVSSTVMTANSEGSSCEGANQTGVGTGAPVRRNVVRETYLARASGWSAAARRRPRHTAPPWASG